MGSITLKITVSPGGRRPIVLDEAEAKRPETGERRAAQAIQILREADRCAELRRLRRAS